MSRRATSFYYSFLVLPAEKREAIVAVWDFCRAVDDAVDEERDDDGGSRARARAVARRARAALRRTRAAHPAGPRAPSCYPAVQPSAVARSRISSMASPWISTAAVRDLRSAAPVLPARGLGGRPHLRRDLRLPRSRTRDYAIELGIALQLTNIIRDVAVDLERGRLYLPLEDLARFGCREEDLRAGVGDGERPAIC